MEEKILTWYNYTKDLGPVIAAFTAFAVALWQAVIQNKQRNLSLLEHRYNVYTHFKKLVKNFLDDCTSSEMTNYSQFYKDFDELVYQIEILFDKKTKTKITSVIKEIKKLDEDYCENRKYRHKSKNKEEKEHLEKRLRKSVKIIETFYEKVSEAEKIMLKFIKESKV